MARSPAGMEHLDLENMSDGQLRELMQHAKETLARRIQGRMDEFRVLAREAGFEVTLTKTGEGGERRRRRRSSDGADGGGDDRRREVSPKYRNPDNASETWSGRGRKPRWLEERLAKDAPLEDFVIRPAATDAAA
jgi:DNA-binding protein H-NS